MPKFGTYLQTIYNEQIEHALADLPNVRATRGLPLSSPNLHLFSAWEALTGPAILRLYTMKAACSYPLVQTHTGREPMRAVHGPTSIAELSIPEDMPEPCP